MPIIRRFTALVLSLSLLHLSAGRANAACATHDTAAEQHTEMPAHHGMDHEQESSPSESCDTSSQPNCCQALAGCSMVLASSASTDAQQLLEHCALTSTRAWRPISRSTAPEPPPPKL